MHFDMCFFNFISEILSIIEYIMQLCLYLRVNS